MQTELIRIGNSRGVRIPKSIIKQCGFGDSVNLLVEDGRVILTRQSKPREGWKEAVAAAESGIAGGELLLDGDECTW